MVFQKLLKTDVEPVKWRPLNSFLQRAFSVIRDALPYTALITPSGKPASFNTSIIIFAE